MGGDRLADKGARGGNRWGGERREQPSIHCLAVCMAVGRAAAAAPAASSSVA